MDFTRGSKVVLVFLTLYLLGSVFIGKHWSSQSTDMETDGLTHTTNHHHHITRDLGQEAMKVVWPTLSFAQALEVLASRAPSTTKVNLTNAMNRAITESFGTQPVLWECCPVSNGSVSSMSFEFVLMPAPLLEVPADSLSFQEHFDSAYQNGAADGSAIKFPNLGGTSTLISPLPLATGGGHYAHFKKFLIHAPAHAIDSFWSKTAAAMLSQLRSSQAHKPIYLSTHGGGIAWLHARIDPKPKYYNFREYKEAGK
jgi:hypothetical protein